MNSSQIKYARERIDQIARQKSQAIREKYAAAQLTTYQKLELLREGRFIVTVPEPDKHINSFFDHVQFEGEIKRNREAEQAEQEELRRIVVRIKDELILGDNEEAMRLLKEFEANG